MKRFLSAGSFVHHFKFVPNSMNIFVSTILNFVCIFYERQFKLRSSFSTCFPISFPVYQKLILSHFVARGSKHEIVPNFEKKRRDKYCKYNIISMQPWRKNMEYGYFNWRESLWSTMKYIEKFRPYFQLYCSYLIPLSFIPFYSFIYFQWNNSYLYILSKYLCH